MVILEPVPPLQAVVVRRVYRLPLPSMSLRWRGLWMQVHLRWQQGPNMQEPAQGHLFRFEQSKPIVVHFYDLEMTLQRQ